MDIPITPQLDAEQAERLKRQVVQLDRLLDNPYSGPQPIAQTGVLEQIGRQLWNATDLDANILLDAIDTARDTETPVRLVVTDAEMHHLPWELLYHDHPRLGFVARHLQCLVLRRFHGSGQHAPRQLPRPLRILLFIASPENLNPERSRLDFEREEELLFTALDRPLANGEVHIDVAEDGCLPTLVERLEEQTYHAVILSMHGTPTQNAAGKPEWGLLFEDARTGLGSAIAGSAFAATLEELPPGHRPSLVVLSACRSAEAEESAESISSVARQLHESGFERVLGMRLSVLDSAASAFSAELFRRAARGEHLGRAVTLARRQVTQGDWLAATPPALKGSGDRDIFAQWTLPVLLDRTADGPLLDLRAEAEIEKPLPLPIALPGDGSIPLPSRAAFIGRRQFIRQHLRAFLDGESRCLMLTGPGGVGKTALAGWFVRKLSERYPHTRALGFRAPFDLMSVYEAIRLQAFDGTEEATLAPAVQVESETQAQMQLMLTSLARRERPCAFVLDNVESLQDLQSLEVAPEHEASLQLLSAICNLPAPTRILLTGRYVWPELTAADVIKSCPVQDAPYGDVLRKMEQLHWPQHSMTEKQHIHAVLGGNHRAIEWMAQLLSDTPDKGEELLAALNQLEAPPDTPQEAVGVVLEAMRQNLLLAELRQHLTSEQDRLLRAACMYREPVNEDGILAIAAQPDQTVANQERLVAYALLETSYDAELDLPYFVVPPVVKELISDPDFNLSEQIDLHRIMGNYYRFQGEYLSRRWSDDIEAIYHFRCAAEHVAADELAEQVCNFYYRISNFASAKRLTEEIVERTDPPAPWWALNRYGLCQLSLGFIDSALDAFEQARPLASTKEDQGTTLNNISGIYRARGDYHTALTYLEQSLRIQRDIGDKAGLIPTLHNMAHLALAADNAEQAMSLWSEALSLAIETQDALGIFNVAGTLGRLLAQAEAHDEARQLLQMAVDVGKQAGFPDVDQFESILQQLN